VEKEVASGLLDKATFRNAYEILCILDSLSSAVCPLGFNNPVAWNTLFSYRLSIVATVRSVAALSIFYYRLRQSGIWCRLLIFICEVTGFVTVITTTSHF